MPDYRQQFQHYLEKDTFRPWFVCDDAQTVLQDLPDESIDFCMTSPPYWKKRAYQNGGIGMEATHEQYIAHILNVFQEVKRVLKTSGSLWLNMSDSYCNKGLLGLPWRIAIAMIDQQGWILRNDVIWNKIKGPDNTRDKLRNTHETIFHFVKQPHGYYYHIDAIRSAPRKASIKNGTIVSATGVTGVRYKRQIELSTSLTTQEKELAFQTLEEELAKVARGEIADFRMVIRNQQRATHSDSEKVSGRAKELVQKGFYVLRYHPKGSKPSDVWDILPEDTHGRTKHYAVYPEDLCKIPLVATCPDDGIALDPFCGSGTTNLVALKLSRKSLGIDIAQEYIDDARERCKNIPL
jgi:DNA modification methylase